MGKAYRVLALVPEGGTPPDDVSGMSHKEVQPFKMEYDVLTALEHLGHPYRCLEVQGDLRPIREAIEEMRPHVVFNMLEEFHGFVAFDHNVVSYLELLKVPYTGCNPRGLILARDKALTKTILSYHRIHVPGFAVFPKGRRFRPPRKLRYPLFVKSLIEEGSTGISQASVVRDDAQLERRVAFVHESVGGDAIAEEYIEGREVYMGMLGNLRVETFPLWELVLDRLPEGVARIASAKVKFDHDYQDKYGITTRRVEDLPASRLARIQRMCKRVYRILGITGYARLDLRLREDGKVFVIEANPNPDLSADEDFSLSAEAGGIPYNQLIRRILNLGIRYHRTWHGLA